MRYEYQVGHPAHRRLTEYSSGMTQSSKVSHELDRLITLGHQDLSLLTALQRKFPDLTEAEFEAGFEKVRADRGLKPAPEQPL
jgi:hypothetical protein